MSEAEHHEFEQYKRTPYCGVSRRPGYHCGQPRDAEVHKVERLSICCKAPLYAAPTETQLNIWICSKCGKRSGKTVGQSAPERIWVPLPFAGVCSSVNRPDLPQQGYVREDVALDRADTEITRPQP